MSPRSAQQFENIRKQKRELILETALELFAENSYHATSISQIAKKAGISKGLSYNYFKSKKEILDEIIQSGFETIYANLEIDHDGVLSEDEFIYFIRRSFRLVAENRRYWKLYYSLMLQPKVAESFDADYIEMAKPILSVFHQFLVSKGNKDPEGTIIAVTALIEGANLLLITTQDLFEAAKMEENIIKACLKLIDNN